MYLDSQERKKTGHMEEGERLSLLLESDLTVKPLACQFAANQSSTITDRKIEK